MDRQRFASHNSDSFAVDRNDKVVAALKAAPKLRLGAGG
jgi:hypothetical protein